MSVVDKAIQTQLNNIQAKTDKTLDELGAIMRQSGLTKQEVEKGVEATARLAAMPSGSMCNYKVNVTDIAEVDAELIAWIERAYNSAG
ncbi:MAG TPA: hypothetical protein VFU22_12555 [Roseiflexaceae bacterium]|nr:hypothetical protein [Roseiflexaceae bacterium]